MRLATLVFLGALASTGCTTYHDDLVRGEKAFEGNEHELALAIFRALEPDTSRLSNVDRARYAYLRGMTDFRIGYRAEARHWLVVAAALEQRTSGSLPSEWTKRLDDALRELNEQVYTSGVESVSNSAEARAQAEDEQPASDSDSSSKPPTSDDE